MRDVAGSKKTPVIVAMSAIRSFDHMSIAAPEPKVGAVEAALHDRAVEVQRVEGGVDEEGAADGPPRHGAGGDRVAGRGADAVVRSARHLVLRAEGARRRDVPADDLDPVDEWVVGGTVAELDVDGAVARRC